jgi:3-methylcrotonyl-CoA carboxylase alpha subunit
LDLPGGQLAVRGELHPNGNDVLADLGGVRLHATLVRQGNELIVLTQGESHRLMMLNPLTEGMEDEVNTGSLAAPMPGSIIEVLVQKGQRVEKGTPLMILEAMKMEHTITAPYAGKVEQIHYQVGEQVQEGVELLKISQG